MLDLARLLQRFLDDILRGDAGVVGAGQPENLLAVHARLAGEDVLDGVVEHVSHRQHAGDIGRGMTMEYAGRVAETRVRVGKTPAAPARRNTSGLRQTAARRLWRFPWRERTGRNAIPAGNRESMAKGPRGAPVAPGVPGPGVEAQAPEVGGEFHGEPMQRVHAPGAIRRTNSTRSGKSAWSLSGKAASARY